MSRYKVLRMKEDDHFVGYSQTDGLYHFIIDGDARWAFDRVKLIPYGREDTVIFLGPNGCITNRKYEEVSVPQLTQEDLTKLGIWYEELYSRLGINRISSQEG